MCIHEGLDSSFFPPAFCLVVLALFVEDYHLYVELHLFLVTCHLMMSVQIYSWAVYSWALCLLTYSLAIVRYGYYYSLIVTLKSSSISSSTFFFYFDVMATFLGLLPFI